MLVLNIFALTVLLGMAALAIDVGSWYQTKRHDQAVADAAALAGAQALPDDPAQATTLALDYANKNGFNLPTNDVSVTSDLVANDTINVSFTHPSPTIFAGVLGINSVTIGATASARSDLPGAARWVAPIAVNRLHAMLQCTPPPCTGATQIDLVDLKQSGSANAAGNFTLLDLTGSSNGNIGNSTLTNRMESGYDQAMPLGTYTGAPGASFNSGPFDQALSDKIGSEVLFPVYQPPVTQKRHQRELQHRRLGRLLDHRLPSTGQQRHRLRTPRPLHRPRNPILLPKHPTRPRRPHHPTNQVTAPPQISRRCVTLPRESSPSRIGGPLP